MNVPCRMVHRVRARRLARPLLVDDLEFLRRARRGVGVAVQSHEPRVERRHVILDSNVRRVALRIDGNEQHLYAIGIGAEPLHRLRQLGERGRAEIGALRITEEHDDGLAAIVGQRARRAVVVDETESRGRTTCP